MGVKVMFVAAVAALLAGAVQAADLTETGLAENLRVLQAVGPEGAGNERAQRAWAEASQADASQLPQILSALDGAGPLAANWIRAAFETIAERQLRNGEKLPVSALEAFVKATEHSPRGRRLAFEWLTRVDPSAPDRLIPGFIDDPSLELRRDAVARLIVQAEKLLDDLPKDDAAKDDAAKDAKPHSPEAVRVLRQAFAGARDLDQIEQLVKLLQSQHEEVDLPPHLGFITSWKLIGPFDNVGGIGFKTVYPPENEIDFSASYPGKAQQTLKWIDYTTQDPYGKVDFNQALVKENGAVGYAAIEFYVSKPRNVDLRVGCICACKLWLNGQLLDEHEIYHSGTKVDQYLARGVFDAGRNVILVKVCQNEQTEKWAQDWEFQLRVCDMVGTAVLSER